MIINGIDTKDISVVVQGAVDLSVTPRCLSKLRESFPGAEIILSTWEGSPIIGLDSDVLILNKDPGGIRCSHAVDNTNRQIVSTKNGVLRCSRKYILKIRSDCLMNSPKLLEYWGKYPRRKEDYTWLKHRIIIPTLYTKRFLDINSRIPTPFHFSDWLQFGLSDDIKCIWNIDTLTPKVFADFYSEENYKGNKLQRRWLNCQYVAESYIYYTALKQRFPEIRYNGLHDYCSMNISASEEILMNNFIVVEAHNLDMIIDKEPYQSIIRNVRKFRKGQKGCYYTEDEFRKIYERAEKE